jgi:aryl-alcohol dehydrogenase-like predicted oxidoreductase
MKFAIGTAQFKKNYGILKNHIQKKEIKKILSIKLKKIDFVDTALSYGNSRFYLKKYLNNKIKIITKLDKLNSKNPENIIKEIERKVIHNFKIFKNKQLYAILFHDELDALWLKNKIIQKKIFELKKKKYFKKIGVSCYDYKLIKKYLSFYSFDIFQLPLNIFNIFPKKINELNKLKRNYNFQIHARSVFLQGVLLKDHTDLPKPLYKLKYYIKNFNKFIEKKKQHLENYLISSIDNLGLVDCIIIGVKNSKELIKLSNYKKQKISKKEIFSYEIKNKKLIDPRIW